MQNIPIHQLQEKTDHSFLISRFSPEQISRKHSRDLGAHRDDHYIFFMMLKGSGSTIVDFENKIIREKQLYYILPEQVHYRIQSRKAEGWYIAVDPSLVDPSCRNTFESWLGFQEPIDLRPEDAEDMDQLLSILHRKTDHSSGDKLNLNIAYSLLRSFFEMAADVVRIRENSDANSRTAELSFQFKNLLNKHIRKCKSPSDYAKMLHISESYLNECLKKYTGSPVSFWIRYNIILEAKRLLYFSDLNVKQIANDLGFEDHSYFSRFFSKETGMTALNFRKKFRD
ncbi:helix-turn-helix domain-containing protein [Chryseobacterium sp. Chry.R1]|uniref:helix-turn-helix domain-containing protein n=1 Tax=Chryseobacterium sp. Chry.R1 TaxID=3139392 RepID=UPI0031F91734